MNLELQLHNYNSGMLSNVRQIFVSQLITVLALKSLEQAINVVMANNKKKPFPD